MRFNKGICTGRSGQAPKRTLYENSEQGMNFKMIGQILMKKIKPLIWFTIIYMVFTTVFYILAGHELRFRPSRHNIYMQQGDTVTAELTAGVVYEQIFTPKIDLLENIGVYFTTFYRSNRGTLSIDVFDTRDNSLILSKTLDIADLTTDAEVDLASDPIGGLYGVPLRMVISADSEPGAGVAPLVNTADDSTELYINGHREKGSLCYTVTGEEYIFFGLHYIEFAAAIWALGVCTILFILWRAEQGKKSYILGMIEAVRKYRFLIKQLVARDFKIKYKRSFLGLLWSFLNPLFMMLIQYFVFSRLFRADISNYPAYLLVGIVAYNFFSEAVGMTLTSIVSNAGLITKVYMPKYIYPVTRTLSSCVNLLTAIVPMLVVCAITGVQFKKSLFLALIFIALLLVFTLGIGLLLSASMVFFRDTQFLWGIVSMAWMYATPIFYPASIIPDEFRFLLDYNPLYLYIDNMRTCIIGGLSPEPRQYFACLIASLISIVAGSFVFLKTQDRFALYL